MVREPIDTTDAPLDEPIDTTDASLDEPIDTTDASLDEPIDDDLAAALPRSRDGDGGSGVDEDRATVRDWVTAVRDAVAGGAVDRNADAGALAVEDLCRADGGEHVATVAPGTEDAETYRFRCFLDGLVLAGLVDERVAVRTPCPETGERVSFAGTLDDLATDAAVVSLGVAGDATATAADGGALACDCGPDCCGSADVDATTASFAYDAVCPYVNAFPSREAYESWRDGVDAPTIAVSPATAVAVARALAA